jgi:predicted dehydrogenase
MKKAPDMLIHPPLSILMVVQENSLPLQSLCSYLQSVQHVTIALKEQLPDDLSSYHVVVTADTAALHHNSDHLTQFVRSGGGLLGLVNLSKKPLLQMFGVQPTPVGPATEVRVLFQDRNHVLAQRLPGAVYLNGTYQGLETTAEETETILYADWHYQHTPVLVKRPVDKGLVACTTLQAYDDPAFQQILYRLLNSLSSQSMARENSSKTIGVGIVGYAESVGKLHGTGVTVTPSLELRAICDLNQERLQQGQQDFPHIKTHASADLLAQDSDVDLVIVATAPNTHAKLALQMMAEGKHVVCEKPLALTRKETDSMEEMSVQQGVHLSCHQNRRWDVDYLAIKQALAEGLLGDLFYMETFVGGFSHPCGYWHSHDTISGGTSYDWGGHYLDWIVSLIPERAKAVSGTRHKRVWHDITNADQERIHILFAGGQEAVFIHSDIAAVRKPKWYLLGTKGALVSQWRDVTEYEIDPLLYFHRHDIPATEMPPDLTVYQRHPSGKVVQQKLAMPQREHYLFHRNLADHLLTGEPITAPLGDSAKVVALLEAAARSASNGCSEELLGD